MEKDLQQQILKDSQIKKFSLYGFLKNLTFFEPYLLIFLMSNNLSLLQIGLLVSIKEIIVNIFEIPSGIIADSFGRKKELYFCFGFYIISFVVFFFTTSFGIAAVAMVFFGLGEAFRSGTHKAIIYSYLEEKGWQNYKTFVYGKTRSSSLQGSAISSLLGILIILNVPSSGYIFLASIVPYILDFFLVLSYPEYLDKGAVKAKTSFSDMLILVKQSLLKNRSLRRILTGEGVYEAVVSSIKIFIQPILEAIIIGTGIIIFVKSTAADNLNIILGIVYFFINIFSSVASRNSYVLKNWKSGIFCLNTLYVLLSVPLIVLGIFIKQPIVVCITFLAISLFFNLRKPIFVDEIDSFMDKKERATILSIVSQLKSLFIVILAPLIGFVADAYGIGIVMFILATLILLTYPLLRLKAVSVKSL